MLATGGASLRVLAAKFEVSHDSLWYHKKHHISREYIAQCRVGPLQDEEQLRELCAKTGTSVLDNLRALNAGFVSRWLVALEAGSDDMLVSLGGQIRKNFEWRD
jgi:hypothetical protein